MSGNWDTFPYQSELWGGSAQGPLLAVGNIYWRDTDRDKHSLRQRHPERFINFMYNKKGSDHNGHHYGGAINHSCCEASGCKHTCGLDRSS